MPKLTRVKPQHIAQGPAAAEQGPASLSLENVLYSKPGHLIRRLHQIASAIFLEETEGSDLTPVQYAALAAARAFPGIDQITLANAIGFDRTTIGGVLDRLEAKGWIARRIPPRNRRVRLLFLTDAGTALLHAVFAANERAQKRMLDPLKASERALFVDMMSRIVWGHNEFSRAPVTRHTQPVAVPSQTTPRRGR